MDDTIDINALSSAFAGSRVVMVTTIDPAGLLNCRPLPLLEVDADGALWSLLDRTSPQCVNLLANDHVAVVAASAEADIYVAVTGHAILREDPGTVRELWRDAYRCWFPRDMAITQLTMLCVIPDRVHSWAGYEPGSEGGTD